MKFACVSTTIPCILVAALAKADAASLASSASSSLRGTPTGRALATETTYHNHLQFENEVCVNVKTFKGDPGSPPTLHECTVLAATDTNCQWHLSYGGGLCACALDNCTNRQHNPEYNTYGILVSESTSHFEVTTAPPTAAPSNAPTYTASPTGAPSTNPTEVPTTEAPSQAPSAAPTEPTPQLVTEGEYCMNRNLLGSNALTLNECAEATRSTAGCQGQYFYYESRNSLCGCATDECTDRGSGSQYVIYDASTRLVAEGEHCMNRNLLGNNMFTLQECSAATSTTAGCQGQYFYYEARYSLCGCATDDCSARGSGSQYIIYETVASP